MTRAIHTLEETAQRFRKSIRCVGCDADSRATAPRASQGSGAARRPRCTMSSVGADGGRLSIAEAQPREARRLLDAALLQDIDLICAGVWARWSKRASQVRRWLARAARGEPNRQTGSRGPHAAERRLRTAAAAPTSATATTALTKIDSISEYWKRSPVCAQAAKKITDRTSAVFCCGLLWHWLGRQSWSSLSRPSLRLTLTPGL